MYGNASPEGTVTSGAHNIAPRTLGTNTDEKSTEPSSGTTATTVPEGEQTGETSGTLPGKTISLSGEDDNVSWRSLKSSKEEPMLAALTMYL